MRGYAAIVGVFRQKRGFLPDRATIGFKLRKQWLEAADDSHDSLVRLGCLAAFSPKPPARRVNDLAL